MTSNVPNVILRALTHYMIMCIRFGEIFWMNISITIRSWLYSMPESACTALEKLILRTASMIYSGGQFWHHQIQIYWLAKDTILALQSIAWMYHQQRSFTHSKTFYELALRFAIKVFGKRHKATARILNECGDLIIELGHHMNLALKSVTTMKA